MAGVLLATALVVAFGCARSDWIDRTLVTENVSGVWFGGIEGRNTMQLDLQHEGPQVTGFLKFLSSGMVAGGPPVPIVGSMAGDLFTFKDERGPYSGELTVGGDEMSGRLFGGFGTRRISLRRVNPLSQPNPPPK
jgi:hypothetical protein